MALATQHVKDTYPQAKQSGVLSTHKEGKCKIEAQYARCNIWVELEFKQTAELDEDCEVMMVVVIMMITLTMKRFAFTR